MQVSTDFWLSGASGASSRDGVFIDVDEPSAGPAGGPPRGPSPRRTESMLFGLVLVIAVAAIAAIYVANRGSSSDTQTAVPTVDAVTSTAPVTTNSVVATTATATGQAGTVAPPSTTTTTTMIGDQPLTLRGMGALETGMSLAQVEDALGLPVVPVADNGLQCQYGSINGDPNSPRLMVVAEDGIFPLGKVVRIELNPGQATRSGIRIGSTKAEVLAAYGDQIEIAPHKYFTEAGSEYLTFVPRDGADADYRVIMETVGDVVIEIRSGLIPFVQQVEGCS